MTRLLGLVAAGHPLTAEAAASALRRGGNAFDAAVAAGFAAAVTEPCLTSLAGGGFLLAHTAHGEEVLFDFFVTAPGIGQGPAPHDALVPVPIRFDAAVQVFHVGWASVATPGVLAGYLHVHERLGRLELADLVGPAVVLARRGFPVDPFLARLATLLAPLLTLTPPGEHLYARHERPIAEGETFANPELAGFLEEVAAGRVGGFHPDDLGGAVTAADLAAYQVVERAPLALRYQGVGVRTNPPPSFGGTLVAHGLERLEEAGATGPRYTPARAVALGEALCAIGEHRLTLAPGSTQGTTHVSVADAEGNVAAMTTSNGSGSGVFAPETGVQLNNVMGEEDLHPGGFGGVHPGDRIGSMMAPTLVLLDAGERAVALGSGGSERIRSALTQVVAEVVEHRPPLAAAIDGPRLHWDGSSMQVEGGFPAEAVEALRARWPVNVWPGLDLYFGGTNGVVRPDQAHGDPRRGGVGRLVTT